MTDKLKPVKHYSEVIDVLRHMPSNQIQDMIDLFSEQLKRPTKNPFQGSTRNPAFYVPRMQMVIDLLARNRERMNIIPHFGGDND